MEVRIQKMSFDGLGIGFVGSKKIYFPGVFVGEKIKIKKIIKKKKRLIASEFEILEPAKFRIAPRCPYFGKCGGCLFQFLSYSYQLAFKKAKLKKVFNKKIILIPSPKIYGYRSKIDIIIDKKGIGFRKRGSWKDVVEIEECPLFGKNSSRAILSLRRLIKNEKLEPWSVETHKGNLRYLVLREAKFTDQFLVNIVAFSDKYPTNLEQYFPYATSIYWSQNNTLSDVSFGRPIAHFKDEFLKEKILGVEYFIHPNSFFQSNPYQLRKLLKIVEKFIKGEKILDLYCGIGTFAIYLAKKGLKVFGVELVKESILMAKLNAMVNQVKAEFEVKKAEDVDYFKYDTVILDPPRAGLHPKLIKKLNQEKVPNLIYVSCNLKNLKRDLELLSSYQIKKVIALDMFPQTPELETVVQLQGKK